jgi:hypothetical protein
MAEVVFEYDVVVGDIVMNEKGSLDSRRKAGSLGIIIEIYRVESDDYLYGENCYLARVLWGNKVKSVYYLSELKEFVKRSGR